VPDYIQELGTGEDASGMVDEPMQQSKLGGRRGHLPVPDVQHHRSTFELEIANPGDTATPPV
jgi:hypothetical protein